MIPYGRQDISEEDIQAVLAVLRSDFLTQGPVGALFEQSVAQRVKASYAVAVNSATSALHLACLALGLMPGDWLWTVPNTFVASANCGRYCGAMVDFIDIDPVTWNVSVKHLEEKLIRARKISRLPKIVVPVHFAGQPPEQELIWNLSQEYGFKVLEDASHAIGASRNGEPVGSCRWSDVTVFSFHPVKIITAGEGGMAVTNQRDLAQKMIMSRSHGITRDPTKFEYGARDDHPAAWYYEQQSLGYNYRLTDIQAALGTAQLLRLDANVDRRNLLAARYTEALQNLPLQLPTVQPQNRSSYHLYVVRLNSAISSHRGVFDALRANGIGVNVHYIPVHLQPYYRTMGFRQGQFAESEAHGASAISLPLYPTLTDEQQDHVIGSLRAALYKSL